ncbi:MAG: pilus assembly protein PilM [Dysgonamonadaceae bacterium]|jgi:cell division protein FtsA|nr:pilus assembly protein PilM [Dysgonamonadaceae bacterium]
MEYIAVLDLGTSKMLAMVASKNDRQKILATEQIDSGDSIRRGLIYKTTEAASKITELIRRLNRKLNQADLPELKQVYIGVGGQGLHTKACSIETNVDGNTVVDDKLLDYLRDKCQSEENGMFELIENISPEYYVDGQQELHPQGVRCEKLEARFQLILGHYSTFKAEVEEALKKENVELVDVFVSPIATAQQTLTGREKERGCALVEFGAGVTYLSIYKDSLLRHLIAIPLGGHVITKDICNLDKTEIEAESLKINEGSACTDDEANELNTVIEARADEIVANILRQIEISGYKQALNAGFILTGGASRLNGLDKLLEQRTDKLTRRVEENPEQSCARGLLQLGNENCAKEAPKTEPHPTSGNLFGVGEIEVKPRENIKKEKTSSVNFFRKFKGIAGEATEKAVKGLFD